MTRRAIAWGGGGVRDADTSFNFFPACLTGGVSFDGNVSLAATAAGSLCRARPSQKIF